MSFEDPFKDSLKGFNDSIKGFDTAQKKFDTNSSEAGKKLEHLQDMQAFKMLQLAIVFSKAEGKTLSETLSVDELKRLDELSARISTEERINIMTEVNAIFAQNEAAKNKNKSAEILTVCRSCGKQTKAGKFCDQCGKPMELNKKGKSILEADENKFFCLGCGKMANPGKFCGNCGGRTFNGAELALFRTINIDREYLLAHPDEAANVLKKQRNAYIKENFQGGIYKNEAEVKKVLEVYTKLIEKLA